MFANEKMKTVKRIIDNVNKCEPHTNTHSRVYMCTCTYPENKFMLIKKNRSMCKKLFLGLLFFLGSMDVCMCVLHIWLLRKIYRKMQTDYQQRGKNDCRIFHLFLSSPYNWHVIHMVEKFSWQVSTN